VAVCVVIVALPGRACTAVVGSTGRRYVAVSPLGATVLGRGVCVKYDMLLCSGYWRDDHTLPKCILLNSSVATMLSHKCWVLRSTMIEDAVLQLYFNWYTNSQPIRHAASNRVARTHSRNLECLGVKMDASTHSQNTWCKWLVTSPND
jgi:hypothetical protein